MVSLFFFLGWVLCFLDEVSFEFRVIVIMLVFVVEGSLGFTVSINVMFFREFFFCFVFSFLRG